MRYRDYPDAPNWRFYVCAPIGFVDFGHDAGAVRFFCICGVCSAFIYPLSLTYCLDNYISLSGNVRIGF